MTPFIIERKVKGGKLFRLRVTSHDGASSVRLSGDFFLEPEEGIDLIESELANCLTLPDKDEAEQRISRAIAGARLQISGFQARDLIDALWEARH